ncbi:MAG: 7-carboxy-7-deazaguanine synthase [Gammaproteobacteria bacterium]|nr:7-carboxy-7-deazaguanine synthase [Gammaproteobacteria bacterium]
MKTHYAIKEIFGPTIQGEGSQVGTVVKFLRFAGCNRWSGRAGDKAEAVCWFCDTDFLGGARLSIDEICQALDALGPCKNLVISGGEPTLQLDQPFLHALVQGGYRLHLETNGSKDLGDLSAYFSHITLSPKQSRADTLLTRCHDIKILYPSPIGTISPEAFQDFPADSYCLQPLDQPNKIAQNTTSALAYCLAHPQWKLSLQIHKILGVA